MPAVRERRGVIDQQLPGVALRQRGPHRDAAQRGGGEVDVVEAGLEGRGPRQRHAGPGAQRNVVLHTPELSRNGEGRVGARRVRDEREGSRGV